MNSPHPSATYTDLNGQVAIVTGAAAGIGLAITSAFLAQGCRVVMIDLDADSLTQAQTKLEQPDNTDTITGSVADPEIR